MFKKKYTKWIPFGTFSFQYYNYITFARKNIKTGMLQFKTKRVNGWFGSMGCTDNFVPSTLIDTKKAWEEITKEDAVAERSTLEKALNVVNVDIK